MARDVIFAIYQMHRQPIIDLGFEDRVKDAVFSTPPRRLDDSLVEGRVLERKKTGKKGLRTEEYARLEAAIRWLIAMLVESVRGGRNHAVVIPLGHKAYEGCRFGHKLVRRVLTALEHMGHIKVHKANPSKFGGYATWITADQRLRRAYSGSHVQWIRHPNDEKFDKVRLTDYDEFLGFRYTVPVPKTPETERWRHNLETINQFTQELPIFLFEDDLTFTGLFRETYLDLAETRYCRVFCRSRLDCGGRFYGPWWQSIRSIYRSTISIGQEPTVEYDYSGMGVSLVYAMRGVKPPDDPYDLGLSGGNEEEKRGIIKEVILALFNDKDSKYRISPEMLEVLGLSHFEAMSLIAKKHSAVSDLFRTDVGMQTQFLDSKIAERVMLEGVKNSILILSVHDSFLVQERHEQKLLEIMNQAYEDEVGRTPRIKKCPKRRSPCGEPKGNGFEQWRSFHEGFMNQHC
jgi:hypothetical protein